MINVQKFLFPCVYVCFKSLYGGTTRLQNTDNFTSQPSTTSQET